MISGLWGVAEGWHSGSIWATAYLAFVSILGARPFVAAMSVE